MEQGDDEVRGLFSRSWRPSISVTDSDTVQTGINFSGTGGKSRARKLRPRSRRAGLTTAGLVFLVKSFSLALVSLFSFFFSTEHREIRKPIFIRLVVETRWIGPPHGKERRARNFRIFKSKLESKFAVCCTTSRWATFLNYWKLESIRACINVPSLERT